MTTSPVRSRLAIYPLLAVMLLCIGAGLRLFDLTDQPIDFHPTRQLRGMIVARGMYYEMLPGADPDIRRQAAAFQASTGQYEPPILERLTALTDLLVGQEVFWIARVYSTLFWLVGGLALWVTARRMKSEIAALLALAFYLVLPFGVQAGRSIQPDPMMVMWMALAGWAIFRWSQSWVWAVFSGLFAGLAVLTKAVSVFTLAGGMIALALYTFGLGRRRPWWKPLVDLSGSPQIWLMIALSLGPTLIYYLSRQGRAAEYFSTWTLALRHLWLEPRFYAGWLALAAELITPPFLLLALIGVWLARGRERWLLVGLWLGYFCYGMFLPYQMDTHSYYHLQLVWLVGLSLVPVFRVVAAWVLERPRWVRWGTLAAVVVLGAIAAWQALVPLYGQDYRNEPAYWNEIASYLPADGKIIALTQDYGYRLMYYGWRKVTLWPNRGEIKLTALRNSNKEFEEFFARRTEGKRYFLITAFRQFEDQPALQQVLSEHYMVAAQGQGYLIFDLSILKAP